MERRAHWEARTTRRGLLAGSAALAAGLALGRGGRRLGATARQSDPQPGGTLRVADSIDATALDPQVSNLINPFYLYGEGLTSLGEDGQLHPFLAREWQAGPDAREYTFRLRDGVTFHNGRAMTAEDVKWSLDRIVDPATAAFRGNDLRGVTVEVVDPLTVKLTAERPNAALPAALASSFILAPESVGADGEMTAPIGTGPFAFVSWTPGQEIRCARHAAYWQDGLPSLDEVIYQIIPDPVARLNALRSGTVDVVASITATDLPLIEGDAEIVTHLTTADISGHLTFNWATPQPPLDDVRVRRAIAHTLNKAELVVAALGEGGPGVVNNQLWSEGAFWRLDLEDLFATPNVDEARRLLGEAGVGDGFATTLVSWADGRIPSEVIKAQLGEIGIEVELVFPPDFTSYKAEIERYEYGMLYDSSYPRDDPAYIFTFFESTNPQNIYYGGYGSPDVDALLAEAVATADAAVRKQTYADALRIIQNDEVSNVFVLSRRGVWGARSAVQGFAPGAGQLNRVDGGMAQAWLAR